MRFAQPIVNLIIAPMLATSVLLTTLLVGCSDSQRNGDSNTDTINVAAPAHADAHGGGYTVIDVPHPGRVTGRVVLSGEKPVLDGFEVGTSQPPICAGAGLNNRLQVASDGGIAGAVVWLEGIHAGKPIAPVEQSTRLIDQSGCVYRPRVIAVPVGQPALVRNSDPVMHNVRVQSPSGDSLVMNVAQPTEGRIDTLHVNATGPYALTCDYHPWMNAYVFGMDHPYYAVSASNGTFQIDGVPPGSYTLKMWFNGVDVRPLRDNEGRIIRYRFSDPITREQIVDVSADGSVDVSFPIEFTTQGG